MLSTGSSAFGPLRFPITDGGGSGLTPPGSPHGRGGLVDERNSDGLRQANYTERYNHFLKALAQWGEEARLNRKYNQAKDAAAEVLVELGFSNPREMLEVSGKEVSAKISQTLRPAAALALSIIARVYWGRTRELEHVPIEANEFRQSAYKLFSLACELDPVHLEHQRAFQNIALDCRRYLTDYQGSKNSGSVDTPIDVLTQGALECVKRFLVERFRFKAQTFDWISAHISEVDRESLSWALEQAATLANARAASLVHRDLGRSAGFTGQAMEFALGCFKSIGLPAEPRRFKDVHPAALVRQGADQARIKRIMRVARLLTTAYLAQREFNGKDAAELLANRAADVEGQAPMAKRPSPPVSALGPRPLKPQRPKHVELEHPADSSSSQIHSSGPEPGTPAAQGSVPTTPTPSASAPVSAPVSYQALVVPPAPPTERKSPPLPINKSRAAIQVSHRDWNALRSEIAASQPLILRTDILNACTTQFVFTTGHKAEHAFKQPERFPLDKFKSSLIEFALDLDILKRGGAPAAALFIDEFSILLGDMLDDALALVRLQVTASFIKNRDLVGHDRAHDLSELAKSCNKAIVALELRRDHGTAQKVFGPIVSAAIDGKLRPS
jgi:hypothetical protein